MSEVLGSRLTAIKGPPPYRPSSQGDRVRVGSANTGTTYPPRGELQRYAVHEPKLLDAPTMNVVIVSLCICLLGSSGVPL